MRELGREIVSRPTAAAAYRVAVDVLKWQAEMRNRAKYGSRVEDSKAREPMNPTKLRAEIKRLETELGIAEAEQKLKPFTVFNGGAKPKQAA